MSDNRETILRELRPYAEEMADFEAPPAQRGKTVGELREYQKFHALAEGYFNKLALLMWENFSGNHLVSGKSNQKKWLQIVSGNRGVYLPFFGDGEPSSSVPSWLNPAFSRGQILSRLRRTEADPSIVNLVPIRKAGFTFKHCIGFFEGYGVKNPRRLVVVDYATGKSSEGIKLDGNAHERVSYKMLQYVELSQALEELKIKMDFTILGNRAFKNYENRFYPSVLLHCQTLGAFLGGRAIDFIVEPEQFLRLAETIYDWLARISHQVKGIPAVHPRLEPV